MYYIAFPLLTIEARMTRGKQIEHEINHWKMLSTKVIPGTGAPQKCMKPRGNGGEGNYICQISACLGGHKLIYPHWACKSTLKIGVNLRSAQGMMVPATRNRREIRCNTPSIISTGALKTLEVIEAGYAVYLSMHVPSKIKPVLHVSLNKYPHFSLSNHKLLLNSLFCKWQFCYLKILELPFICKRHAKLICSVQTCRHLIICKLKAHNFRNTQPSLSHPVATAQRTHTWN